MGSTPGMRHRERGSTTRMQGLMPCSLFMVHGVFKHSEHRQMAAVDGSASPDMAAPMPRLLINQEEGMASSGRMLMTIATIYWSLTLRQT